MKRKTLFILLLFSFTLYTTYAQNDNDSLSIVNICRNYIEGWKDGDLEKISSAVSPELVKRTVMVDMEGNSYSSGMSYSLFKSFARSGRSGIQMKDFLPEEEFRFDVIIYDITGDFAITKTIVPKYGFFDYCQLARFNGEWKIFNILWGWIPE